MSSQNKPSDRIGGRRSLRTLLAGKVGVVLEGVIAKFVAARVKEKGDWGKWNTPLTNKLL